MVATLALALLLFAQPSAGLEVFGYAKDATGGEGKPRIDIAPNEAELRRALSFCNSNGGAQVHFSEPGNITLVDNLNWTCSNVTIDGSDAPNGGVQFANGDEFRLNGVHNVIIRHIRFRGTTTTNQSQLEIDNGTLIVFDHISCQWATDGCPNMGSGTDLSANITIQFSLLSEPSDSGWDAPAGSGANLLIGNGVTNVTLYRNAFISSGNRNPQIAPLEPHTGISHVYVNAIENFFHNFIYGMRIQPGDVSGSTPEEMLVDITARGNIWQRGPIARPGGEKFPIQLKTGYLGRAYLYLDQSQMLDGPSGGWTGVTEGSVSQYDPAALESNDAKGTWPTTALADCDTVAEAPCAIRRGEPNTMLGSQSSVTKESILSEVGATLPCRDSLDRQIIAASSNESLHKIPLSGRSHSLPDLTQECR